MKKITVLLLAVFCIAAAGCSKDEEINAFLTEWETVTNEMSAKMETGDVDAARAAFDAKKDSLKTSWDSVKNARGFQVSDETKKKMESDAKKNMSTLTSAAMKGAYKVGGDKQKSDDMKKLVEDYGAVFK